MSPWTFLYFLKIDLHFYLFTQLLWRKQTLNTICKIIMDEKGFLPYWFFLPLVAMSIAHVFVYLGHKTQTENTLCIQLEVFFLSMINKPTSRHYCWHFLLEQWEIRNWSHLKYPCVVNEICFWKISTYLYFSLKNVMGHWN